MFIPTTDDNVCILINGKFDFFHITCLDVVLIDKNKLLSIPVKLCHAVISLDMNMDGFMFFAVKEERETVETKNFWHNYNS